MSKIIPGAKQENMKRWDFSDIGTGSHPAAGSYHEGPGAMGKAYPTVRDIETIKKQIYEESYQAGYNEGYADGLKIANEEMATSIKAVAEILLHLKNPEKDIDLTVKKTLAELAILIARQIISCEVGFNPDQIMPVIDEAVRMLGPGIKAVNIYLHPKDADVVRQFIQAPEGSATELGDWNIIEADDIERGGCRVKSESSTIDSSITHKLEQMTKDLFQSLERSR